MNAKFEARFIKLEKQRELILKKAGLLTMENYNLAVDSTWSVSQILTHLIVSEQLSLNYMKKKALGIDNAGDSGFPETLKMLVLKLSQRLPIKYKAPKIIVDHTPDAFSMETASLVWQQLRIDLKTFGERIPDENLRKKIFKHPVAGRFNILQAMDFFYEHIRHHWPQMHRRF